MSEITVQRPHARKARMNARRDFLRTASAAGAAVVGGIALVGCASNAPLPAAWRPSPGEPSVAWVPVSVGGRRVRTIDVHAHCYIPEALALLGAAEAKATLPPVRGQQAHFIVVEDLDILDSDASS